MNMPQNENENMHPIKGQVANLQKRVAGSKRKFGNDLTNQQLNRIANQNNKRAPGPRGKPSKATEDADLTKKQSPKLEIKVVDDLEMREMQEVQERDVQEIDDDGDDQMSDLSSDSLDSDNEMEITPEPKLMPWDEAELGDDLTVPEYAEEIMDTLRKQEDPIQMKNFMDKQKDVNTRMRTVLVDWLIEVHRKFKLSQPTYFLAINMVDRFLATKTIKRTKLQLLGCTCLWIASKYHEIYAPEMDDFVYIADNAFSAELLTEMEVEVLKELQFELTVPTVLSYAERYAKISSYYLKKERERKIISDLILYCTEHSVLTYDLCQQAPSLIGAACFVYSCLSTKVFTQSLMERDGLEEVIGYTMDELKPTMKILDKAVKNAKRSKHKALFKKYSHSKYSNIGKLNFARLNIKFLEE